MLTACTHELPVLRECRIPRRNLETTYRTSLERNLPRDLAVGKGIIDRHGNSFLVVWVGAEGVGDLAGELLHGGPAHGSSLLSGEIDTIYYYTI